MAIPGLLVSAHVCPAGRAVRERNELLDAAVSMGQLCTGGGSYSGGYGGALRLGPTKR